MSMVGVNSYWTCSKCKRQAKRQQLLKPGMPPDLPEGWILDANEEVVCSDHYPKYARVVMNRAA